ncbi:hypothetical protein [Streptomyces caniscabiei]|uniref:Uncharacterized protein n=1 Tax=Streptomyces caniscabiei TaxID=2746961 RepID=A0ABU4N0S8_9ACTN|nr:hypothetical protein [Streptomyces caniscabiei]MBE4790287.1 hypothetical protein [Streptomyces caniscabiei]MBE4799484.1 hypothetical protein [Streptomyces caniscabiei]MDX3015144.1 hypothetical protein [Streptomyces caniscabiei]MDX3042587.1 hypothetical protein [Streptomyces caniscabiei]
MSGIQNPTDWSDFDFLEFEAFVSKVENEGFTYAAENYGPNFESPDLQAIAADLGALRTLYVENEDKVESWWLLVGSERACGLHNAHVDEERKRREDARLFGIRCTDGHVITYDTAEDRDGGCAYLLENKDKGWRVPDVLLVREAPGGEWTDDRPDVPTPEALLVDLGEIHTRTCVSPLPKHPAAMGWQATAGSMAAGFARALHALNEVAPEKAAEIAAWFQGPFEDGPDPEEHTDWLERHVAGSPEALQRWVDEGRRMAEESAASDESLPAAEESPA